MEGALLFHDDVPGQQAPGLVNEHLDAEGPLPPDVILGHPYPYTAPNQAAFTPQNHASLPEPVQDDVAFGEVNPRLVQPALAQDNTLGLIFGAAPGGDGGDGPDLGFAHPQPDAPVPNTLPTALVAVTNVIHSLRHNHPELAAQPDGPGLVSALHTALTNYMLVHGLLTDALGAPHTLQEDLPPLDGLEDLVGLPGDEQIALPDAPDGIAGALVGELFEADAVLVPLQNGLAHLEVAQQQQGAPTEPAPLLGVIPDIGPAQVIGEPGPVMEPGLAVEFNAVPAVPLEGVVVNYENEVPNGVGNVAEEENAPPPYGPAPAPEPEHAEEVNDEVEIELEPVAIAVVNHHIVEVTPPEAVQEIQDPVERTGTHSNAAFDDAAAPVLATITTGASISSTSAMASEQDILVRLDEEGQAALSLLCAQFDITYDPDNLKRVLMEAWQRMYVSQTVRVKQPSSGRSLFRMRESSATAARLEKPNRILKLRDTWKRAFTVKSSKSPSGKEHLFQGGLTV